jgi:hypothetical protein
MSGRDLIIGVLWVLEQFRAAQETSRINSRGDTVCGYKPKTMDEIALEVDEAIAAASKGE